MGRPQQRADLGPHEVGRRRGDDVSRSPDGDPRAEEPRAPEPPQQLATRYTLLGNDLNCSEHDGRVVAAREGDASGLVGDHRIDVGRPVGRTEGPGERARIGP